MKRKTIIAITLSVLSLGIASMIYSYGTDYWTKAENQIKENNVIEQQQNLLLALNTPKIKPIVKENFDDIYIREDGIKVDRTKNEKLDVVGVEEGSATERIINLQKEIEKIENEKEKLHEELFIVNNEISTYKSEMRLNEDEKLDKRFSMENYLLWLYEITNNQSLYLSMFQTGSLRELISNYDLTKKFIEKLNDDILRINSDNKELDLNRNNVVNKKIFLLSLIEKENEMEEELLQKHEELFALLKKDAAILDSEMLALSSDVFFGNNIIAVPNGMTTIGGVENFGVIINGEGNIISSQYSGFIVPVQNYVVTSEWGDRTHPIYGTVRHHAGIDLGVDKGEPVVASASGVVTLASWYGGYGKAVIIKHNDKISTLYGHNSALLVSEGDTVTQGQPIALAGSTGNSTGPHCHFEVRIDGDDKNPRNYLNF